MCEDCPKCLNCDGEVEVVIPAPDPNTEETINFYYCLPCATAVAQRTMLMARTAPLN